MKTATVRELRNQFADIAAWLEAGEDVLLTRKGKTVGRIIPEPRPKQATQQTRKQLFANRFAPLKAAPQRDLSDITDENRDR